MAVSLLECRTSTYLWRFDYSLLMTDFQDEATHIMDLSGLYCPEPVMMLHNKIREAGVGETISVVATDPATERDIPKFCHFLGHQLLHSHANDGKYFYLIQKGKGQSRGAE